MDWFFVRQKRWEVACVRVLWIIVVKSPSWLCFSSTWWWRILLLKNCVLFLTSLETIVKQYWNTNTILELGDGICSSKQGCLIEETCRKPPQTHTLTVENKMAAIVRSRPTSSCSTNFRLKGVAVDKKTEMRGPKNSWAIPETFRIRLDGDGRR